MTPAERAARAIVLVDTGENRFGYPPRAQVRLVSASDPGVYVIIAQAEAPEHAALFAARARAIVATHFEAVQPTDTKKTKGKARR